MLNCYLHHGNHIHSLKPDFYLVDLIFSTTTFLSLVEKHLIQFAIRIIKVHKSQKQVCVEDVDTFFDSCGERGQLCVVTPRKSESAVLAGCSVSLAP